MRTITRTYDLFQLAELSAAARDTAYNEWLVVRMQVDKELTTDLVKTMNRYQDMFLSEQIGNNKSLFNGN